MAIYAKCIKAEMICNTPDRFEEMQDRLKGEHRHCYCEGKTTKSWDGSESLYSVPLNHILDCAKYGEYIAVIEMKGKELEVYTGGKYLGKEKPESSQKILKIMSLNEKSTIDFIFNEVGNPSVIGNGGGHIKNEEIKKYILSKY